VICGASSKADENGTHEYSEVRIVQFFLHG
jgi:hypothetical protein